jgi:hypothetical protein
MGGDGDPGHASDDILTEPSEGASDKLDELDDDIDAPAALEAPAPFDEGPEEDLLVLPYQLSHA